MKLSRVGRNLRAVTVVAVVAGLVLVTVNCRKQTDESTQANGAGTHSSMSGMNMSMPGKNTSTDMNQSMPDMNMPGHTTSNAADAANKNAGGMTMPMEDQTGSASNTSTQAEGVTGRRPVDLDQQERQLINIRTLPLLAAMRW